MCENGFLVFFYSGFWFMWKDLVEIRVGFSGFILFYGVVVMEIQIVGFSGFKVYGFVNCKLFSNFVI